MQFGSGKLDLEGPQDSAGGHSFWVKACLGALAWNGGCLPLVIFVQQPRPTVGKGRGVPWQVWRMGADALTEFDAKVSFVWTECKYCINFSGILLPNL